MPDVIDFGQAINEYLDKRNLGASRWLDPHAGSDDDAWARVLSQLGLGGVLIPEHYGGLGLTMADIAPVLQVLGGRLAFGQFLSNSVLFAASVALFGTDAIREELLPHVAEGSLTGTVALCQAGKFGPSGVDVSAVTGDQWRLSGTSDFVLDASSVDRIVVLARAGTELRLFLVDPANPGVRVAADGGLDITRQVCSVTFRDVPALPLAPTGLGDGHAQALFNLASAALAAEMVGGMQASLDMSVSYAKSRIQFGQEIGAFQAVKHKCADMLISVELARAVALDAVGKAGSADEDSNLACASAAVYCSEAFAEVAGKNLQIHGGIGFTWEHVAHLYLKRAKSSQFLFGSSTFHRRRLVRMLGSPAALGAA